MAVTPRKKVAVGPSSRVRSEQLLRPTVDDPIPASAMPTAEEIDELGRFADRVAQGRERLKYIKL
jgi:hypothetical protein